MTIRHILILVVFLVALAGLATGAFFTQQLWYPRLFPQQAGNSKAKADHPHEENPDILPLSEQAQKTIGLSLKPAKLQNYQSTIRLPGMIVPQPGKTTLKVTTPIGGVVDKIAVFPGQTVHPNELLFTLHLHYHEIHKTQADLYKAKQEILINQEEQERIKTLTATGTVAQKELFDLKYQQRRLEASMHALQGSLQLHHFSKEQIQRILTKGEFVSEWTINAPSPEQETKELTSQETLGKNGLGKKTNPAPFEMADLLVKQGDHVEAGQALCVLSNHQKLFVEARVFQTEIPLIEEALQEEKKLLVEVLDLSGKQWSQVQKPLNILYLEPHVNSASQTVGVYLDLPNQFLEYTREGKTYRTWKYRPGQRVYVTLPAKSFTDVFVLPTEAVAKEGLEHYVFRQKGDAFVRKPVQVLYQDQKNVVIANDGSIFPGNVLALNGADQLLRALVTKTQGGGGHGHEGHGHAHPH